MNKSFLSLTELQFGFEIALPNRVYYIRADSEYDREEWMKAIQMVRFPFLHFSHRCFLLACESNPCCLATQQSV